MGACHKLKSFGPLFVRLGLGSVFIAHGAQLVLGWWGGKGLQATVQGFTQTGFPLWVAYSVPLVQLLAGLGVLFGLLTRLSGLGLAVVMGGAIYFVHWKSGFFINWMMEPGKSHGYEFNLALLAMGLSLVFSGGGFFSIDRLLFGKKCCPHGATEEKKPS